MRRLTVWPSALYSQERFNGANTEAGKPVFVFYYDNRGARVFQQMKQFRTCIIDA